MEWASHSPNMSPPPDFFLCRFLKDNIYQGNARAISLLKVDIPEKTHVITVDGCEQVINNFARCIPQCLKKTGIIWSMYLRAPLNICSFYSREIIVYLQI